VAAADVIRRIDSASIDGGLDLRKTRTQSKRVHLLAGWPDIGNSFWQLRLRHGQRIESLAQQLDLIRLCHQVPSEQMVDRSPSRSGARVRSRCG